MKSNILIAIAACSLIVGTSVGACELHAGFGGGAWGSSWQPYDPNGDYGNDSNSSTEQSSPAESQTKARPVFSSSALRSSKSAKAKLADRKADADTENQNTQND